LFKGRKDIHMIKEIEVRFKIIAAALKYLINLDPRLD
jgi:hypothetical protein